MRCATLILVSAIAPSLLADLGADNDRAQKLLLTSQQLKELVDGGFAKRNEIPYRLEDAATGKPILLHGGTLSFNAFRKKWIMIGSEIFGSSMLGEVWYAESEEPEGPWIKAVKVATHDRALDAAGNKHERMDFYNPAQHAFYDQQGGRLIIHDSDPAQNMIQDIVPGLDNTYFYDSNSDLINPLDPASPIISGRRPLNGGRRIRSINA